MEPRPPVRTGTGAEGDESRSLADNSLGRLLTLCDGVFAIAMTLLTFELRVPDIGGRPSDAALRHALARQSSSYLSFALSFYLIASYWRRHRRVMRSVVAPHPRLFRGTVLLLFVVASMPFLSELLGQHGSDPISLALYGAGNAVAVIILLLISRIVERYGLLDDHPDADSDTIDRWDARRDLAVFLLCIPGAYLIPAYGPYLLVLLGVPIHVPPALASAWRRSRHLAPHRPGLGRARKRQRH